VRGGGLSTAFVLSRVVRKTRNVSAAAEVTSFGGISSVLGSGVGFLESSSATLALMSVTMTRIERSGPAVQAALAATSPGEAEAFRDEYRASLTQAAATLDLTAAEAVLLHWWGIATIRANPLTAAEEDLVRRVRDGEELPPGPPVAEDPRV
jgi:hypothetical protein